jgi:hypothetical protein
MWCTLNARLGDKLRRNYVILVVLALIILTASCAANTRGSSDAGRSSRDPITIGEIRAVPSLTNGYEVVQRLRPRWLRPRGRSSISSSAQVVVFLDNVHLGGVESLYNIAVERITEIRFFDAADATSRWGTGFSGGAIEVITGGSGASG